LSEAVDDAADGVPEAIDRSFGSFAQEGLELGEGVLDGIEVGAVIPLLGMTYDACVSRELRLHCLSIDVIEKRIAPPLDDAVGAPCAF
jgi:hypothetical protein